MTMEDERLRRLNSLAASDATTEFLKCCGSMEWARRMATERPFASLDELLHSASQIWWSLASADWLEAFDSHPKIGEKKAASEVAMEAQRWSEDEQAAIRNTAKETMQTLADLNRVYQEKFGYIFIVCASGKSSEEMLAILQERIGNRADQELQIAASEQAKITRLRLAKLLTVSH